MLSMDAVNLVILIGIGVIVELVVVISSIFLVACIAFKGFKIGQGSGEGMIGGVPKGAVFTVGAPEEAEGMAPDEDEQNVLKKAERFLSFMSRSKGRGAAE